MSLESALACAIKISHLSAVPQQMKAVVALDARPISDPLALQDKVIDRPILQPRDLLVQVKAVAVNPADAKRRARSTANEENPLVLGFDAAGIVVETGSAVSNFKVGDQVFYAGDVNRPGANAEFHAVDERLVALKPQSISFAESAALPLTSLTAYEGLEQLGLNPALRRSAIGKNLLLISGAGGVGSMVIQLAKWMGMTVIATASRPESIAWVKNLGANFVVNYRDALAPQVKALGVGDIHFIFNAVSTSQYWDAMAEMIAPRGRIVSIVETDRPLDLLPLMRKSASFSWEYMFTRSTFQTDDQSHQSEILKWISDAVDAGHLRTTVSEIWSPLNAESLRKAHLLMESATAKGKIVIEREASTAP